MWILLVEDDESIAEPLAEGLSRYGIDVCRELRRAGDVPIIMLTARGDEADRVLGLEMGADDYLAKPFSTRELVARMRAVGRRTGVGARPGAETRLGPLVIDERTRQASLGGVPLPLTPKEFQLLTLLAADPGAVVDRRRILESVWEPNFFGRGKTLDFHVATLRRKLGDARWIENRRGVGFRLAVPPPSAA